MAPHRYAPSYCEENVWWLAQEARFAGLPAEAVIVSNAARAVQMSAQRASASGEPVLWDYHVVLAVRAAQGIEVWDLDCTAGAPLAACAWLDASFDPLAPPALAPRFRRIEAGSYVATFASDRRHMRHDDGTWIAPPPPWPIVGGGAHALDRWLDLDDEAMGPPIDLRSLRARWR